MTMINHQQPGQKRVSRLKEVSKFVIAWLLLICLLGLLLVGVFPPRVLFSPLFLAGILSISGTTFFLLGRLFQRLGKKTNASLRFDNVRKWSRNKKVAVASAIMAVAVLVVFARPIVDVIGSKNILERAKLQFVPITYGTVPTGKVDRTLVELQRALDRLRKVSLDEPPSYLINVHLFSDVTEFIRQTGASEWSAGGTLAVQGQPPELYIPVEREATIWNDTLPTTTPEHEIAHIVTFEVLKFQSLNTLPLFFVEGIAGYESQKALTRFDEKWFSRMKLISYRNQLSKLEAAPSINIRDGITDEKDVVLFYCLSQEFVGYLVRRYGELSLWQAVKDAGQGMNIDGAFMSQYGKEYDAVFSEFLGHYY